MDQGFLLLPVFPSSHSGRGAHTRPPSLLPVWYEVTPYKAPHDLVFAASSSRAGKKRGKQPVWLSTVTRCHIQPVVKRLGITKQVSWHTFRHTYTTLLHANGEDVKVVQELLRHSSARVTMDVYAEAQMPAKRAAQQKVVEMIRPQIVEMGHQMRA
ncbi:MAG TPA: tyrosine-type recombinase/integrase [Granulicella sp.]